MNVGKFLCQVFELESSAEEASFLTGREEEKNINSNASKALFDE